MFSKPAVRVLTAFFMLCGVANAQVPDLVTSFSSVYGSDNGSSRSFIRIFNPTNRIGRAALHFQESEMPSFVTSHSLEVPAMASVQMEVVSLLSEAVDIPSQFYRAHVQTSFDGFASHVVWNADEGVLINLPTCGSSVSTQGRYLTNVHTHLIAQYPSRIGIQMSGGFFVTAKAKVYDAVEGTFLGQWTSKPVVSKEYIEVSAIEVLEDIGVLEAIETPHINLDFGSGLRGFSNHLVSNHIGGVDTEMTSMCSTIADKSL